MVRPMLETLGARHVVYYLNTDHLGNADARETFLQQTLGTAVQYVPAFFLVHVTGTGVITFSPITFSGQPNFSTVLENLLQS